MESTDESDLAGNRVKEILACKGVPFSQATDFLEGRVVDDHGNNFCSQDTLLILRNQAHPLVLQPFRSLNSMLN